ncbi:MAG: hypothetical protein CMH57_02480 [Myxococcales bacterium]|nr:hypothetical protein [Myxococcales bacterium]
MTFELLKVMERSGGEATTKQLMAVGSRGALVTLKRDYSHLIKQERRGRYKLSEAGHKALKGAPSSTRLERCPHPRSNLYLALEVAAQRPLTEGRDVEDALGWSAKKGQYTLAQLVNEYPELLTREGLGMYAATPLARAHFGVKAAPEVERRRAPSAERAEAAPALDVAPVSTRSGSAPAAKEEGRRLAPGWGALGVCAPPKRRARDREDHQAPQMTRDEELRQIEAFVKANKVERVAFVEGGALGAEARRFVVKAGRRTCEVVLYHVAWASAPGYTAVIDEVPTNTWWPSSEAAEKAVKRLLGADQKKKGGR